MVLGGGSTGEAFVAALRRLDEDVPITLVERELVGGECTYFACMPSKTLLRAPELVAAAAIAPGAAEALDGDLDAERIFWWRDQVVDGYDDTGHATWLADRDVELVRGTASVLAPGRLQVGDRELSYAKLVIATGSRTAVPPVPGLEGSGYWTSREATSAKTVPKSLIVLGGGAVGCELAQFYRRLGARVHLVQRETHLLMRQDREAGELLQRAFEDEGIDVHLRTEAARVTKQRAFSVQLSSGETIRAERLLVATGRQPNVRGLGLERLGVRIFKKGIRVDDRLGAARNVWAIGDAAGVALFTHVGKYQARVAAVNVAGGDARADYRAIPAATFTDPQVATCREDERSWARHVDLEVGGTALDLRAAEAPRLSSGLRRPRPESSRGSGRRGPGSRRVARPAHARDPCRGAGRRDPRHDPALPDVLRSGLLRRA